VAARLSPWILLLPASLAIACSESTFIRTTPPGASVYVNERYLGASPAEFAADSWSVRPHAYRYRVVKAGYAPSEGEIPARLSIGRIITAYFSGCLSCARGFYVFDEDTVIPLQPDADAFALPPAAPDGG
jgi:hypothetical protein